MKAFVSDRYGPPSTMKLRDVPNPAPGPGEVLVKVLAVSLNPADWRCLRAKPAFSRMALGLFRPKHKIPGVDVAGRVVAIGSGVTRFKPGDKVYANLLDKSFGGFAEYVAAPEDVMATMPAGLSFEEAAAMPMAAVTALQGLLHHGPIRAGQKVLVNGASGGVGHFAVQIAKAHGAHVTGVTSARNIELVRRMGADAVIDYAREDFASGTERYDLILDAIGNRTLADLRRALMPEGKAAVVGFTSMRGLLSVSLRGGKRIAQVQAHVSAADLETLGAMVEAGLLRPSIDKTYPFAELPTALGYVETGRARGKVVAALAA